MFDSPDVDVAPYADIDMARYVPRDYSSWDDTGWRSLLVQRFVHAPRAEQLPAQRPEGGTAIVWSARFEPGLPWTGPFWRWYLTRFMRGMADGFARYAENGGH